MEAELTPGQQYRFDEAQPRFHHLLHNFERCLDVERSTLSFNESPAYVLRALSAKRPRRGKQRRLHPAFEMVVADRLKKASAGTPSPEAVEAVCKQVATEIAPLRGPRKDGILIYHLRAAMVLCDWICGEVPYATLKEGTDRYSPRARDESVKMLVMLFRERNPKLTEGRIVRIIRDVRLKRLNEGKVFRDFFPFYGATVEAGTELPKLGPGYRLKSFTPNFPLYCS